MSLQGIYQAGRALLAHQRAMEVTGQNIANVQTPGYSRQVAVLRSVPGSDGVMAGGSTVGVGGSVDASVVQRMHSAWLDRAADGWRSQSGEATTRQALTTRVEQALGEPGSTGLSATLDRFFSAFQGAADRPDDTASRSVALRTASETATRFNQAIGEIESVRTDAMQGIKSSVGAINNLVDQIATLSGQIGAVQATGQPASELLDQRDNLLADLTRRTGAAVTGREGGDIVVSLGGATLVQGKEVDHLVASSDGTLSLERSGATPVAGGELGAYQKAATSSIPAAAQRLTEVRDALIQQVNTLHTSGTDRTGAAGVPLFVVGSGGMQLNPALESHPERLVTGDGSAGDGTIARAISDLSSNAQIMPAYRTLAGDIATKVAESKLSSEVSDASLSQVTQMQASESGVNLDEELSNMVSQQHVYQASARLLSTYDQMLDTLINRTGV